MKKILLTTALVAFTAPALADQTAVFKLEGQLVMSACTPSLSSTYSGNTVVNYGSFFVDDLSDTSVNQLGKGNISLQITCPVATKVSWHASDNQADTTALKAVENGDAADATVSTATQLFGVGLTNDGVKIGNYSLYVDVANVSVNTGNGNSTADAISRDNNTGTWAKSTTGATTSNDSRDFTVATAGSTEPVAYTVATFPLVTSLAVQDTTTLNITDDTDIDGQATITLRYL